MSENKDKQPRELTALEKFFQFNRTDMDEKEKDLYGIVALAISAVWLVLTLVGVGLGLIWFFLLSVLFFRIVQLGLSSSKKTLAIISIVLFVINAIIYILLVVLSFI